MKTALEVWEWAKAHDYTFKQGGYGDAYCGCALTALYYCEKGELPQRFVEAIHKEFGDLFCSGVICAFDELDQKNFKNSDFKRGFAFGEELLRLWQDAKVNNH